MKHKIQIWQWPNILSLDAALIAMSWQWVFSNSTGSSPGTASYLVLGLSVWLTYQADRLLDVSTRSFDRLSSSRHRFAKQNKSALWRIWWLGLFGNVSLALTALNPQQLARGFALLAVCLLYTFLNQHLSKRFFPKELLVAIIFASGTQVFLPQAADIFSILSFTIVCLANCLIISIKERAVDARLRVRSLSNLIRTNWLPPALIASLIFASTSSYAIALVPPMLGLMTLYALRAQIETERFRVLADLALLAGPVAYLCADLMAFLR